MRLACRFTLSLVLLMALSIALIPTHNAHAATFDVCTLGELTAAITIANGNGQADIINFNCSTTLNFTSALTIADDGVGNTLTINSNGNTVIADGGDTTRFFVVNTGASLELNGFTLQNGYATGNGGVVLNGGTLTISNSTLTNNETDVSGGAIFNTSGSVTISNSLFANNLSMADGGAIANVGGTLTITNSNFINNSTSIAYGGAIFNTSIVTITNGTFTSNQGTEGGAIYSQGGILTVTGATFNSNTGGGGGAMYLMNSALVTINTSTFTANGSNAGGAIYLQSGDVTVNNSRFTSNAVLVEGGAIYNLSGTLVINDSEFITNIAGGAGGDAIHSASPNTQSNGNHYEDNDCVGAIVDLGGNTVINATGCPGSAPIALDLGPLMCSGNNLLVLINAGDANFDITGIGMNLPIENVPTGSYIALGAGTWTDVTITERRGERESINIGGISCPNAVIIPPTAPTEPIVTTAITVLGCALDVTDGVEVAGAPDNTYCRILMKDGGVISYSGAIPAELISLGVILAVDVYRLEGGMSQNTFPDYARVCLAGQGRLFYMDSRQAPRVSIELASESVDGLTCGWIPAPGTLILTN